MNILIYGAGVLGCLYAARLKESGQNVSILARGQRCDDLRKYGIIIQNPIVGKFTTTYVSVVDSLAPEDIYDLIMVFVRKNQLANILPILAANRHTATLLFMLNNATGPGQIVEVVECQRVLIGFPGAGGTREGNLIRAIVLSRTLQPTCLGELAGSSTPRVREIARLLKAAGFPTVVRSNMDAWLKTHAAIVSPIANALYMMDDDIHQLANQRESVQMMLRAVREGFRVLRSLDIPITPTRMRIFELIPEPLMILLLQRLLDTEYADLVIARHASAARDEMKEIADEIRELAHLACLHTPYSDHLHSFI